jgi:hypothetical protein
VATGYEHEPVISDWGGRESFTGRLLHACEHRNVETFGDRKVLVVGPGCSGMEISCPAPSTPSSPPDSPPSGKRSRLGLRVEVMHASAADRAALGDHMSTSAHSMSARAKLDQPSRGAAAAAVIRAGHLEGGRRTGRCLAGPPSGGHLGQAARGTLAGWLARPSNTSSPVSMSTDPVTSTTARLRCSSSGTPVSRSP